MISEVDEYTPFRGNCRAFVSHQPSRADARRNRRRLLDAAIALVLETGSAPSRDAIAQRAGVGIATLYRHFPDQPTLLRAVVVDVLDRTITLGNAALAHSASGGDALRTYMHAAIDAGLGVVNVIHARLEHRHSPDQRAAAQVLLERLIEAARTDGAIDQTVTATDIAIATIRFCRPLAIGLTPADDRAIAHRHLDSYLDGLMPTTR
jgi:AcrR family transcriptional regulator